MKWSKSLSGSFAAIFAFAALAAAPAASAPIARIAVQIELQGVQAISAHVRRSLPAHLARELTRHNGDYPAGSRMVVSVREIFLANDIGIPGRSNFGGLSVSDAMEGEVSVLDARGRVIVSRRVSARSPMSSGGSGPITVTEPRRVEALVAAMAYWAVQALN